MAASINGQNQHSSPHLEIDHIRDYLINVGYKIEYPILVNAFKKHLYNPNPDVQGKIRTQFKDYVNRLATVSLENNMKFINLRPEFRLENHSNTIIDEPKRPVSSHQQTQIVQPPTKIAHPQFNNNDNTKTQSNTCVTPSLPGRDFVDHLRSPLKPTDNDQAPPPPLPPKPRRQPSQVSISSQSSIKSANQVGNPSNQPVHQPMIPPRVKSLNQSSQINKNSHFITPTHIGSIQENLSGPNGRSNITGSLGHLPTRSNTMKENRLSRDSTNKSLSHALQRSGSQITTSSASARSRSSHREDESDSSSLQPIDPLRRRWAIEACTRNYNGLMNLLREDVKLAGCKDFSNGYTAIHWAAKFGDLDIIKLIAGTHGVSANIKSNAGYTPLHVAYMFDNIEVANLLLNCYKADPKIRDHTGKLPIQYAKQSTASPEHNTTTSTPTVLATQATNMAATVMASLTKTPIFTK